MIELVDPNDSRAVRNKNNVLRFYDLVINQKKSEESISTFMTPGYIQHNPLIPGSSARSPRSGPMLASSSIRSLRLATMCLLT